LNALAEGKTFLRLGAYAVSPNSKLLGYGLDFDGSRRFTLRVKNLETGELLPDEIPAAAGGFVWGNDNATFFYNVYDSALRSHKILRHELGSPVSADVEVFHEKDEKFDCYINKTRNDRYLIITTNSKLTSEIWYLDADSPRGAFQCFEPRKTGHEYAVSHHDNAGFIIWTNDKAKNYRIMTTPVGKTAQKNWKELIAHRPKVKIDDIDVFEKFLALSCRENGLTMLEIFDIASKKSHKIAFPEAAYLTYAAVNPEYKTAKFRYGYTSLITPNSVYDYDVAKRESTLLKRQEVPGYNPDAYAVERIFAKAKDGALVPMSLVYKKGLQKNGANPALLYAYGSYGYSTDPTFSGNRVSLLDRGFVFAIAHIRGGSEMGRQWYEDGKLLKKKNTFTDFIAAAEHLIKEKYTSADKLAASGGSAGGLLMGAVMNMRPDLFKTIHAAVPFVDVINTMLDASIPLTTSEYEEWGNPNDKIYYEYMKSYSPYDNIAPKAYPHLLLTTGLNDSQVPYWEPAKFCAKLRATKTDNNLLIMKTEMGVGHGGASGRYDALKERAFEYAFFLKTLGIAE
jgi:oligopeptidase B